MRVSEGPSLRIVNNVPQERPPFQDALPSYKRAFSPLRAPCAPVLVLSRNQSKHVRHISLPQRRNISPPKVMQGLRVDRERQDPALLLHELKELREQRLLLQRLPRTDDDELRTGAGEGDVHPPPVLHKVPKLQPRH